MMNAEKITFEDGIFQKAINEDEESIKIIFKRFISSEENILYCNYFGIRGLWGFGGHTWGCVTNKRVAVLELEPFRRVLYKDAFHEKIDCGVIYQPHYIGSILFLIVMTALWLGTIISILTSKVLVKGFMKFFSQYIYHYDYNIKSNITMLIFSIVVGFSLPFIWHASIRGYYRLVKSGLFYKIRRDGVYLFSRKKYMSRVIEFYRHSMSVKS